MALWLAALQPLRERKLSHRAMHKSYYPFTDATCGTYGLITMGK